MAIIRIRDEASCLKMLYSLNYGDKKISFRTYLRQEHFDRLLKSSAGLLTPWSEVQKYKRNLKPKPNASAQRNPQFSLRGENYFSLNRLPHKHQTNVFNRKTIGPLLGTLLTSRVSWSKFNRYCPCGFSNSNIPWHLGPV